jgi:colanic acid biosynthesis glycosyl transferase WcaI
MKILIYGLNFSPELTGIGKYTGEMAEWLAKQGHEIRVITAPPYYPAWEISPEYSAWKFTTEQINKCTIFRCPLWVPSQPKTLTRLIHLLSFTLSSFPLLLKQIFFWRPVVVICIAPSFFCAPQAVVLSKLAGIKSWLHFQDFEICAIFNSGMISGGTKASKIAHQLQGSITRQFDTVSCIAPSLCINASKNRASKNEIVFFPNWVDIDFIVPEADASFFRNKWKISSQTKVILYSGNLGKKQGLDIILDAAQSLQHRKDILFVIVGNGAHKTTLLDSCKQKQLKNIQFHSLQPYEHLPSLLRLANVHLLIQKRWAADAVLPSKLTSILSVGGNCLITADQDTELGRLVIENPGIATLIPPEDKDSLIEKLVELCDTSPIKSGHINQVARKYAENKLGKEQILKQFEHDLLAMLNR